MKPQYIRDLKPNENVTDIFLVHTKEIRQKRTGEPYLSLVLSDKSGDIEAKMWDNVAEVMDTFDRDDFVKVKGLMQLYNNRPQFTIHRMRLVQDHEVEFSDFFPASARDAAEMWNELRGIVSQMQNAPLRALIDAFLDDPEISSRYKIAPAAKTIHHAFRSGLLEHVLSLCGLAKLTAGHYANIDRDLLIAGVVLHDIGKIHELSYERGFNYTAEGQLLGHITIAIRMLSDKLRAFPDFPAELRNLLEHMILSHHGQLEFGSPKVPIFPEALLLHYLDDLDSKMECMRIMIEKEPASEGLFSPYSTSMQRVALRKSRYILAPSPCMPESKPVEEPAAAASDPEWADDETPALSAVATSFTTSFSTVSSAAGRVPFSAPPKPKAAPASNSFFGEKLKSALTEERK